MRDDANCFAAHAPNRRRTASDFARTHRQRAMELGVDQYMGKPYQEEQLLETLNQLLTVES